MIPHPYQIAVIVGAAFIILELFHGAFIFLGFGIGALAVSIAEFSRGSYLMTEDVIVFVVTSAVAIAVLRHFFRDKSDTKVTKDDVNQY